MKNRKKISIEDKIWHFVDQRTYLIYFISITIVSLLVRYLLLKYNSGDYDMFLKPWFDELKMYGGLLGLKMNIGNYTPIYMTILALLTYLPVDSLLSIKIVSVLFDYIGGIYLIKIVLELLKNKKSREKIALVIYSLYLFLPTVFINSAYWAQSDGIYTAFVLISLYYLIKKDFTKGIIFWSIAFAFKFQAIFIFPLYVLMYFNNRNFKFKTFLIIPLVVFILSLPKAIFSHNLMAGFEIYYNQAGTYSYYLTLNLPNIYSIYNKGRVDYNPNLVETPLQEFGTIGILFTLMLFMTIALLVYKKKIKFDKEAIIDFALWSILICTFFLPQMHERYLFMGDVISLLYFIFNKKKFYIPIIIELISLNGYMYLLFGGGAVNMSLLSIVFLIMLIWFTKDMYLKYFKE